MKGQVVMIDVGQGDCFFIQQPYARGNVLIDTGGLQKSDLATSRLIPYLQSQGVFIWMPFLFRMKTMIIVER